MNKGIIRRKLSIYCSLFVLLIAFGAATFGPMFTWAATASAATGLNSSGTWVAEASTPCSKRGSKDSVTAYLAYSNNKINNGNPITFQCVDITHAPNGRDQMILAAAVGSDQCEISVGANPTGSYETNTFAVLETTCAGQNDPDFLLTNTYKGAAGTGATPGGNATWTGENPGQLTAGTITVNGYTEKGEVFKESVINGDVMTLLGTKNADSKNCGGNTYVDQITVGDSGASYLDATSGTVTIYQYQYDGSNLSCTSNSATVTLDDSYSHVCNANGVDCTNTGGTTTNGTSDSCAPGNLLAWILCPVFDLLDAATSALNSIIGALLVIPTSEIFNSNFQNAFDVFRNAGIALLVIAGLVMVISQASDLEIFSAHTVRKALPRIMIAAIGISLAWPLLQLTLTFFNDIGDWIGKIILFSIGSYSPSVGSVIGVITGTIGGAVIGILAAGYALATLSLGGIGLLLLSAILIFIVSFLVLALRQIVVLLCILLAPLAIASYVLPGTEKLWKFWKDTLLTTLLMYPIIMAFLAAGAAMAHVALSVTGNPFMGILALVLYIAPYVMIPFAFKLAGGIMASAIAMVEGTHRKSIEGRLSKMRQEDRARQWGKFKAGNRYAGNNAFTSRLNTFGGGLGAFMGAEDKLRFIRNPNVRNAAIERQRSMNAAEYAKLGGTAATQFNDDMLWAQTYRSANEAQTALSRRTGWDAARASRAVAAARAQGGFGVAQQTYATQQLAATGTGYANMDDMLSTVARVSGGNSNIINSMIGNMRSSSERAGRNDLKAGFGDMVSVASDMAGIDGASMTQQERHDRVEDLVTDAVRGIDNATLLRNKTASVGNGSEALVGRLQREIAKAQDTTLGPGARGQAAAMVGALTQKIENMVSAGSFGYGPELNQEKLGSILARASSIAPRQQGSAMVTNNAISGAVADIQKQRGYDPRQGQGPPDPNAAP